MSEPDISWIDMAAQATAAVESFATNEELLALFAGAVFALHQDTIHACAVDMARADDPGQAAAINAAQPTPLGDYAARVVLTMKALGTIERANRELIAHGLSPDIAQDAARVHLSLARLRLTAARLWLLTMQARAGDGGGAGLRVGVAGLWARLQTVPGNKLGESANIFVGSYYDNIRSDQLDLAAWPLSP